MLHLYKLRFNDSCINLISGFRPNSSEQVARRRISRETRRLFIHLMKLLSKPREHSRVFLATERGPGCSFNPPSPWVPARCSAQRKPTGPAVMADKGSCASSISSCAQHQKQTRRLQREEPWCSLRLCKQPAAAEVPSLLPSDACPFHPLVSSLLADSLLVGAGLFWGCCGFIVILTHSQPTSLH